MTAKEKTAHIKRPTPDWARAQIQKFEEKNKEVEQALQQLFEKFPENRDPSQVLLKVNAVNSFYHTRILDKNLIAVANHIANLAEKQNLDTRLQNGDKSIVVDIRNVENLNDMYSFATKYCNWHSPAKYPIVDNYVKDMLYCLNESEQNHFYESEFTREKLNEYDTFCAVYEQFMKHFNLTEPYFTYKKVDEFLWQYANTLNQEKNLGIGQNI